MRADRLIAILLTLKHKKKTTAAELAQALEVSERTIYRDVVAMSAAGIPVYTEKGPGGGICLLEDYRADLADLTPEEIEALSLLNIPEQFEALGLASPLRSALLKLNVFPREGEQSVGVLFDPTGWQASEGPLTHLQTLLTAYRQQRQAWVRYRFIREMVNEAQVDVLGLAAKESAWYVVWQCGGKISVHDLSAVIDARVTEQAAITPAGFSLTTYWKTWCTGQAGNRSLFTVRLKVARNAILLFNQIFGSRSRLESEQFYLSDTPEWVETLLEFPSFESARYQLMGFGGALEVLEPEVLRSSLEDFAGQIAGLYQYRNFSK